MSYDLRVYTKAQQWLDELHMFLYVDNHDLLIVPSPVFRILVTSLLSLRLLLFVKIYVLTLLSDLNSQFSFRVITWIQIPCGPAICFKPLKIFLLLFIIICMCRLRLSARGCSKISWHIWNILCQLIFICHPEEVVCFQGLLAVVPAYLHDVKLLYIILLFILL